MQKPLPIEHKRDLLNPLHHRPVKALLAANLVQTCRLLFSEQTLKRRYRIFKNFVKRVASYIESPS
jgi:hypothetical protein